MDEFQSFENNEERKEEETKEEEKTDAGFLKSIFKNIMNKIKSNEVK